MACGRGPPGEVRDDDVRPMWRRSRAARRWALSHGLRARRSIVRRRYTVTGVVQGVGFRPFVHRVATELGLSGLRRQRRRARCSSRSRAAREAVAEFARRLVAQAPPLARIASVRRGGAARRGRGRLRDRAQSGRGRAPRRSRRTSRCARTACAELFDPADRRYRHPFITCTNCGPRFTIITGLPYDRPATTMAAFPMCAACAAEYADPADRRFHAQPMCCPDCGPTPAVLFAAGGPRRPTPRSPPRARRWTRARSSRSRGSAATTWPATRRRGGRRAPCGRGRRGAASRSR